MTKSYEERYRDGLIDLASVARKEFVPERDNGDLKLRANITLISLLENSEFGRKDAYGEFRICSGEEWFDEMAFEAYPLDNYSSAIHFGAKQLLDPYGDILVGKSIRQKEVIVKLKFSRVNGREDTYGWFM